MVKEQIKRCISIAWKTFEYVKVVSPESDTPRIQTEALQVKPFYMGSGKCNLELSRSKVYALPLIFSPPKRLTQVLVPRSQPWLPLLLGVCNVKA